MAEEEKSQYVCPFVQEICYQGRVRAKHSSGQCQFWERDTAQAPQCKLLRAAGGLAAISEIPGMLQSLASQGNE